MTSGTGGARFSSYSELFLSWESYSELSQSWESYSLSSAGKGNLREYRVLGTGDRERAMFIRNFSRKTEVKRKFRKKVGTPGTRGHSRPPLEVRRAIVSCGGEGEREGKRTMHTHHLEGMHSASGFFFGEGVVGGKYGGTMHTHHLHSIQNNQIMGVEESFRLLETRREGVGGGKGVRRRRKETTRPCTLTPYSEQSHHGVEKLFSS